MNKNPNQRLAAIDTIIGADAENVLNNCETQQHYQIIIFLLCGGFINLIG
ncbi:hypothetical protein [Clostridium felsineum]|nr:hypothetical protein [Clostridium felsineum]